MISICIPVYNYNVSTLVEGLKRAVAFSQVPAEIIIYEDGSETLNPEFEKDDTSGLKIRHYSREINKGDLSRAIF
ncbi:MAG: glycosyltransferase [Saprospiraceae bacterium]|nr:glycosyltransferase [Saprospiraceae bacterium]